MGNNIEEYRRRLKLSQSELAALLRISNNYMNKIERGKKEPSVRLAIRIANVLNCRVEDIFFED